MSIKPVDFQVILPKTSEISKLQNDNQQKNQMFQQQQNDVIKQHVENNLKQVYSQDKPHEAEIHEKQEKDRENKKKKKGNYRDSREPEEEGNTIDIKI